MTWWLASLLGRHGGDYGTKDIQVLHYVIWPWRRILNGTCISISNLLENIAWQTHRDDLRPEARGPLKSGAWGCRPTCHPQKSPLDSSVVNDPLGEPCRTSLYVGLPSVWGSVDGDLMFFPICRRASFWGLRQTYMNEWMNRPVALVTENSCPWGPCQGMWKGLPYLGLWGKDKKRYIKRAVKMPYKWVSLSIGALMGNLEGICLPGLFERKG